MSDDLPPTAEPTPPPSGSSMYFEVTPYQPDGSAPFLGVLLTLVLLVPGCVVVGWLLSELIPWVWAIPVIPEELLFILLLVAFFGLRPMAAALTARPTPALAGPSFDDVQRSLPTPETTATAEPPPAALPSGRSGPTPLDDLRQKIRPAPQERLARMVDLNEERTAQILRKWAAQEAAV